MKYDGELKKAVVRKRIGLLADTDAEAQRITFEVFSKLPALFEAHGVRPGDWMTLAIELAKAHVPGFQVNDPPGAPTKWCITEKAEFRIDVDSVIADKKLSIPEAIKLVIRQPRWADKAEPMTMGALEKQYKTTDMRWVQVVQDARSWEKIVQDK
jgi:hypothetical protein